MEKITGQSDHSKRVVPPERAKGFATVFEATSRTANTLNTAHCKRAFREEADSLAVCTVREVMVLPPDLRFCGLVKVLFGRKLVTSRSVQSAR